MKVKNNTDQEVPITGFPVFKPHEVREIERDEDAQYLLQNPNLVDADAPVRAVEDTASVQGIEDEPRRNRRR